MSSIRMWPETTYEILNESIFLPLFPIAIEPNAYSTNFEHSCEREKVLTFCVYTKNEDNQIEFKAIKQVNKQTRYTWMMMMVMTMAIAMVTAIVMMMIMLLSNESE